MRINVVTVRSGWILQKIAERIVQNAPAGVDMEITHNPRHGINNFYVDVQNCYRGPMGGKDVGLFTHVHENDMRHVPDTWFTLNAIIHMSRRSYDQFYDDRRYKLYKPMMLHRPPGEIPPGFDYKKPTIGIFQRGKYEGKGFNLMMELADSNVASYFRWIFAGNDWEPVINKLSEKTDVLSYEDDSLKWPGGYLSLYDITDYVLIPSKWEGGPMSLIEAAALGKQIIAPGVGWVQDEIPVDHLYKLGDVKDLRNKLFKLVETRLFAREAVHSLSYKDYAKAVCDTFEGL